MHIVIEADKDLPTALYNTEFSETMRVFTVTMRDCYFQAIMYDYVTSTAHFAEVGSLDFELFTVRPAFTAKLEGTRL